MTHLFITTLALTLVATGRVIAERGHAVIGSIVVGLGLGLHVAVLIECVLSLPEPHSTNDKQF